MLISSVLRCWVSVGLGLLLTLSATAQSLPEPAELIREVLATHPTVRKAEHLLAAAQATLDGSRLQPNPILTLSATAGDAPEDSNALTQSFEISGQPGLRDRQSGARLEAARQQLRAAKRDIAGAALGQWLQLWESRNLAAMAQLRTTLVKDMVRVARRRYEVGEIPQNEALRVELAAAEAQADAQRAQAALGSARNSLDLMLGRVPQGEPTSSALTTVEVQSLPRTDLVNPEMAIGSLFQGPDLAPSREPWSLDEVLLAADRHPSVVALREEQKALSLGADLVAKERAPQLGLSLYRSKFLGSGVEQGAQLSISWPLFDWGSLAARQRAQHSQAQAQLAAVDERVLELRGQVADLWNRWQAVREVRDILTVQAQRYEELAREARIGYDLGLLSLTDVLQTETAFRGAGVELIEVQAEVLRLELGLLERTDLPWPIELLEEQ